MRNHTATHLLHWALKQVFGKNANQAGSLVAPDRLRFDVTLPRRISPEEILQLENMVNEKILENQVLKTEITELEKAKAKGAMALFGEKYGEKVRLVNIGDFSLELCGGTHLHATGEVGAFIITSEAALQTGVRRIEAVTGMKAVQYIQERRSQLQTLSQILSTPQEEVVERVQKLLEENKELRKKSKASAQVAVSEKAKELLGKAKKKGKVHIVTAAIPNATGKDLQSIADYLAGANKPVAAFLAGKTNGKVHLVTLVTKDLVKKDFNAQVLMKEVSPLVGGKGGGRPDRAQGGGTMPEKLDMALQKAEELMSQALS